MTSEPRAMVNMSGRELIEFADEMRLLVGEQANLFEFPCQGMVVLGDESRTVGPWVWTDCAAVLRRWAAAGLLCFYRAGVSGDVDLSREEGISALDQQDEWTPGGVRGPVAVYESEQGATTPWDEWLALVISRSA